MVDETYKRVYFQIIFDGQKVLSSIFWNMTEQAEKLTELGNSTEGFDQDINADMRPGRQGIDEIVRRKMRLKYETQTNRPTSMDIRLEEDGWVIEVNKVEGRHINSENEEDYFDGSKIFVVPNTEDVPQQIAEIFQKFHEEL